MNTESEEITFNPESAWKRASNYMGHDWTGWYYVIGQNRDSGCLDRSNYAEVCKRLAPWLNVDGSGIETARCSHWACGWTEEIMISRDAPKEAVEIVADLLSRLADYPVLNECLYTDYQMEYAESTWDCMSERERVEILTKLRFENAEEKAKSDYPPSQDDDGRLWEYLTADCG